MDAAECDAVVIGGGVVGLAVAAELARERTVIVLESHGQFGRETSGRNSEVVHSGIYYPAASRKTEWCIRGRQLLYEFCATRAVPFARTGKFVVATTEEEEAYLVRLCGHATALGVACKLATGAEIMNQEPLVRARAGAFFPETGIVDSHELMAALQRDIRQRDGVVAYRHRVEEVVRKGDHWSVRVATPAGPAEIHGALVVNAAGLGAAELSHRVLGTDRWQHRYCRGRYFALGSGYRGAFRRLVYPVPPKDGLGVHVTLDLAGGVRLGPDVDWCDSSRYAEHERHYECDWSALVTPFAQAARRYLPGLKDEALAPAFIGIRPKLFVDGVAHPDFVVEDHAGFVHTLGIESPGLTSALAIAEHVATISRARP